MIKKLLIPIGITAAAALGCAAAIIIGKPPAQSYTAYVYQNGKEIARLPLDGSADGKTITVTGEDGAENIIEVTGKKVQMKSASCPDQLCVKMGWRDRPNSPIVCLPHKIVIDIKGTSDGTDAEIN
ncbi:MAG: NusG domain II-containing protein [Ruminococcus sp.]|nr:NusG domain II-containing protein [Ruminococcus sp.]